ncbi:hypothetical protein Aspvir_001676 [Aspergillus viridinutans]|uniref:Uncharacterized protein n=1 Tax=Aspergillus viridinutans TaxID=75553 RepID=A0A9P3BVT1_ASPVI|nr:uncharacterized protein Aspvir_001676 [Aspergillus viridinutans]GIJ99543.1 hypothetical protein Aspvir_001676 [Aspergillus viridinutans]
MSIRSTTGGVIWESTLHRQVSPLSHAVGAWQLTAPMLTQTSAHFHNTLVNLILNAPAVVLENRPQDHHQPLCAGLRLTDMETPLALFNTTVELLMGVAQLIIIAAESPPHLRENVDPSGTLERQTVARAGSASPDRRSIQRGAEAAVVPGTGRGSGRLDPFAGPGDRQDRLETNQPVRTMICDHFAAGSSLCIGSPRT